MSKKEVIKKSLQSFWDKNIRHRFQSEAINHLIKLRNDKLVRYVDLDSAATTMPFLREVRMLQEDLKEYGSVHRGSGQKSKISTSKFEEVRKTIEQFVHAKSSDYVVFVPNTTCGMNQLAYFFAQIKGKIIVSDIEHSSSWLPWVFQEGKHQFLGQVTLKNALNGKTDDLNKKILDLGKKKVITYKTNDNFEFDLEDVEAIFKKQFLKGDNERIKLLVVTGASNVTSYKPPIKELAHIAHRYKAMIVVDGCQLLQHEKIDMQKQGVDFLIFSGHKMYAPFGSGAIVGNRKILDAFWPYQMGGGNFPYINKKGDVLRYKKNRAHDPGTPNFVGARALHYAIKELENIGMKEIVEYEHKLAESALIGLKRIPRITTYVDKVPGTHFDRSVITYNLENFPPKLVAEILNHEYGIGTRAGAYCVYEFSRRIHHISLEEDRKIEREVRKGKIANIPGSIRASFSLINQPEDVVRLLKAIREITGRGYDYYQKYYVMNKLTGSWHLRVY